MFKVLREWSKISTSIPLQRLTADERVSLLKAKFKLKELTPLHPILEGYDTKFWHVCYLTQKPISSIDGVRLSFPRKEWQDGVYASLKSILDREHVGKASIHPFELSRVKQVLESVKNGQK